MLSLAPDDMPGKTGTPGIDAAAMALVTAATKSGRIGEASVATEPSVTSLKLTAGIGRDALEFGHDLGRLVAGEDAAVDVGRRRAAAGRSAHGRR